MPNTTISDKLKEGKYLAAWKQFKDESPATYTAAAILPVSGQVAALADYAQATDEGNQGDAVIASASLIPGFKLGKMASKLAPASLRLKSQMNVVEQAIAPTIKHAPTVGKVMAGEQLTEYAIKKREQEEKSDNSASEYLAEFNNQPR